MIGWLNSDERGASAVLVAASLFLLMGFTALTIDWGAATNQRRQNQSAADFGVLAAAQFANVDAPPIECGAFSGQDLAACKASVEVRDIVNANLGLALLAGDWAACVDTDVASYPEFTPAQNGFASPITDCVRFSESMQKVRVFLPTIAVDTTFGQIMGRAVIDTGAFAHAQADFKEASKVIPFALPSNLAGQSHGCLKTSGNPNWDVCDGSVTGNFGSMDIRIYGNETTNTDTACTGNANDMLLSNIARGVDHPLSKQPDPAGPQKVDDDLCPIFNAKPNSSLAQPGVGSNLDDGLTFGGNAFSLDGSSYPGRLQDGGGVVVRNSGGPNPITRLNNTPLWNYLIGGNSPGFCNTVYDIGTGIDTPTEMQACLDMWGAGVGVIFEPTIKDAKRYAFVPEFHIPFGTPGTEYRFKDFRPVYLNTTYYGCSAGTCSIVHTPGVSDTGGCGVDPIETCGTPGPWNNALEAVTAFIFKPGMLPADALDPFPGDDDEIEYALIR
ncbi:MAG: Tad domain-containing protein [Acidimicrobiia bacterium]|nr:Tad domain-containing protein [Acidimicrobiia bacterium]